MVPLSIMHFYDTNGSRLIFLPLATQMFQFAKFEKSKERRLATELGYGFPIRDPDEIINSWQLYYKLDFKISYFVPESFGLCAINRLQTFPLNYQLFHLGTDS